MNTSLEKFDFEDFKKSTLDKLKAGASPSGKEGAFTPLLKAFSEEALEGEMEDHLSEKDDPNRRNGRTTKKIRSSLGEFELTSPRGRAGSFKPQIVQKRQRSLPNDIEKQIFALYARGSSMGDMRDFMEQMYDVEISRKR